MSEVLEVWKYQGRSEQKPSSERLQTSTSHYSTSAAVVALWPYLPFLVGRSEMRRAGRSPKRDIQRTDC